MRSVAPFSPRILSSHASYRADNTNIAQRKKANEFCMICQYQGI